MIGFFRAARNFLLIKIFFCCIIRKGSGARKRRKNARLARGGKRISRSGENGKETEIGRYDACTRCYEILKLNFDPKFPDKYKTNIHKLFRQAPKAIFFYKDEVISGVINKNTVPQENENFKEFKEKYFKFLKENNYAYKGVVK